MEKFAFVNTYNSVAGYFWAVTYMWNIISEMLEFVCF